MKRRVALQLEALGQPFRLAVATASGLGYTGATLAARQAFHPDQLSQTGRREVRHLLQTHQLRLVAVAAPLERGLDEAAELDRRVTYLKRTLDLAFDLGPRLVLLAAGPVPSDANSAVGQQYRDALGDLARHADRVGCLLALEAGLESAPCLRDFLATFNAGSLGVSLDPATLLLRQQSPEEAVRVFAGQLLHVYARDARPRRLDQSSPEAPLGGGDVPWLGFLGALEEVGYAGWLTVKRGPTADPLESARSALQFLTTLGA